MGWTDSHLHQFVDAPIVYSVPSGDDYRGEERLTNGGFAWLTSRDTKRRPLFTNTILATAGRMKWSSKRPCPLTLKRTISPFVRRPHQLQGFRLLELRAHGGAAGIV